jgi:hypothetical protein
MRQDIKNKPLSNLKREKKDVSLKSKEMAYYKNNIAAKITGICEGCG